MEIGDRKKHVTIPEACYMLGGVTRQFVNKLANDGKLDKFKVGRRTLFLADQVENLPQKEQK